MTDLIFRDEVKELQSLDYSNPLAHHVKFAVVPNETSGTTMKDLATNTVLDFSSAGTLNWREDGSFSGDGISIVDLTPVAPDLNTDDVIYLLDIDLGKLKWAGGGHTTNIFAFNGISPGDWLRLGIVSHYGEGYGINASFRKDYTTYSVGKKIENQNTTWLVHHSAATGIMYVYHEGELIYESAPASVAYEYSSFFFDPNTGNNSANGTTGLTYIKSASLLTKNGSFSLEEIQSLVDNPYQLFSSAPETTEEYCVTYPGKLTFTPPLVIEDTGDFEIAFDVKQEIHNHKTLFYFSNPDDPNDRSEIVIRQRYTTGFLSVSFKDVGGYNSEHNVYDFPVFGTGLRHNVSIKGNTISGDFKVYVDDLVAYSRTNDFRLKGVKKVILDDTSNNTKLEHKYLRVESASGNYFFDFTKKSDTDTINDLNGNSSMTLSDGAEQTHVIPRFTSTVGEGKDYSDIISWSNDRHSSTTYEVAQCYGTQTLSSDFDKRSGFNQGLLIEGATGHFTGDFSDPDVAKIERADGYMGHLFDCRVYGLSFRNIILDGKGSEVFYRASSKGFTGQNLGMLSTDSHPFTSSAKIDLADSVVVGQSYSLYTYGELRLKNSILIGETTSTYGCLRLRGANWKLFSTNSLIINRGSGVTIADFQSGDTKVALGSHNLTNDSSAQSYSIGTQDTDLLTRFVDEANDDYRIKATETSNFEGQGWNGSDIASWAYEQYSEFTPTNKNFTINWSKYSSVIVNKTIQWGKYNNTPITPSQLSFGWDKAISTQTNKTTLWSKLVGVIKTLNASWSKHKNVSNSISPSWSKNKGVESSLLIGWDKNSLSNTNLVSSWSKHKNVSTSITPSWSKNKSVTKNQNLTWSKSNDLGQIERSLSMAWSKLTTTNRSLSTSWDKVVKVTSILTLPWYKHKNVSTSITPSWSKRAIIDSKVISSWTKLKTEERILNIDWSKNKGIEQSNSISWSKNIYIDVPISIQWDKSNEVLFPFNKSLSLTWDKNSNTFSNVNFNWQKNNRPNVVTPISRSESIPFDNREYKISYTINNPIETIRN